LPNNRERTTGIYYRATLRGYTSAYKFQGGEKLIKINKRKLILGTIQDNILRPVLNEKPTYWRLTIPQSEASEINELVWSIQGVIVNKDLPPVLNR
jgi:hypothetical protein